MIHLLPIGRSGKMLGDDPTQLRKNLLPYRWRKFVPELVDGNSMGRFFYARGGKDESSLTWYMAFLQKRFLDVAGTSVPALEASIRLL
jgi:hypothetical protein